MMQQASAIIETGDIIVAQTVAEEGENAALVVAITLPVWVWEALTDAMIDLYRDAHRNPRLSDVPLDLRIKLFLREAADSWCFRLLRRADDD